MPLSVEQKKELVNYWKPRVELGEKYKDKFAKPKDWERFKKYYRGDWASGIVPVNKTFSHGKALVPRVYFRDPQVTITATRPELEWHARVVEKVDNYLIRELDLKSQLKRAVLDAYCDGVGIIKLGYDSEYGYVPEQAVAEDGATATQGGEKDDAQIEYRENVKEGMPWALRTDPVDIVTPWGYQFPESLPWIAHYIYRPLEDVKEDSKYDTTARSQLVGGVSTRRKKNPLIDSKDTPYCELVEIRDLRHKRLIVLCEEKILLVVEDQLQLEGLPYVFIIFNEDPDYFWGIPEARMMEPQQKELNDIRTQASRHRRLSIIKLLVLEGAISDAEIEKFKNEEIMPVVKVKGESLQNVILPVQASTVPPELWKESEAVSNDLREVIGESRNQAGEYAAPAGSTPPTATESMKVDTASNLRSDDKRDIVADALVKIVRKWNQMIFKFWTGNRVTQIIGPNGALTWIKYTGEQLTGEYLLNVDPDSGLPVTKGLRFTQAKELFIAFNGDPMVDQMMLRKLLLRQTEWVDPAWSLIIPWDQNEVPPELLMYLKQSGIKTLGEGAGIPTPNKMPQMTTGEPMNTGKNPLKTDIGEAVDIGNLPKTNATLSL